jgi:hypothetical protein
MASTLRFARTLRTATTRANGHRLLSHSTVVREESNLGAVQTQKKPIGGIRGGYVLSANLNNVNDP